MEVAVIMAVQNIKVFEMGKHADAHAVAHNFKLIGEPEDRYLPILFMMGQVRVNIRVGGKNRGVDAFFFEAIGNFKSLIGWAANIR